MRTRFVVLVVLGWMACANASAQEPIDTIRRFVKMDVEGERVTPQGWREADQFFVKHSAPPSATNIVVIEKRYAVSESALPKNAGYYLGYWQVGRLDSSMRFHPFVSKVEARFFSKYTVVHATGVGWKIEGSQPTEMHLTPKAAIRFLTQMRNKSIDPDVKRNAAASIAELKRYE